MVEDRSIGRRVFLTANWIVLSILTILCVAPFVQLIAVSLSSGTSANAGEVVFTPISLNMDSYNKVIGEAAMWTSMLVSVKRVALGVSMNILMTILIAYPLSKERTELRLRNYYAWFFVLTMLFTAGLIPQYILIRQLGLLDNLWALLLPAAVPVYSVTIMLNFFRQLPKEMSEAAFIDGCGHWRALWQIYVPTSLAGLATISIFSLVFHWNSWFDGLLLMNSPDHYPLQTYLQVQINNLKALVTIDPDTMISYGQASARTIVSAQIVLGALPILLIYPFLQQYFSKGIVLGTVKG